MLQQHSTLSVWLCVEITGAGNQNHWNCFFSCCSNVKGKQMMADFRVFLVPFSCCHCRERSLFVDISDLVRMHTGVKGDISLVGSSSNKNCELWSLWSIQYSVCSFWILTFRTFKYLSLSKAVFKALITTFWICSFGLAAEICKQGWIKPKPFV